jgi:putative lipoic acid-binding regulatory protein
VKDVHENGLELKSSIHLEDAKINQEPLPQLSFPLEFPLKIIGRDEDDFTGFVVELVSSLVPGLQLSDFSGKRSRAGNYVSVSVTFIAESRAQVDALYEELGRHERVLYVI